jgi:hypothetical protein
MKQLGLFIKRNEGMKIYEVFTREKLESLGIYRLGYNQFYGGLEVEDFKKLDDKELKSIRGIGESKASKLIWLRDYLNGKVSGKYVKEEIIENIEVTKMIDKIRLQNEKIKMHNEKEEKLCKKIRELEESNSKLRKELTKCRKRENKYQKAKDLILSIE